MPTAAIIVGAAAAVGTYATIKSNLDKSKAEQENADYYKEQAAFAQKTADRDEAVFYQNSRQTIASQQAGYAAGGVDATGSPLFLAEDQYFRQSLEAQAIKEMGSQKVLMATTKQRASQEQADTYGSLGYNLLTGGATALAGGAGVMKVPGVMS